MVCMPNLVEIGSVLSEIHPPPRGDRGRRWRLTTWHAWVGVGGGVGGTRPSHLFGTLLPVETAGTEIEARVVKEVRWWVG